MLTYIKSLTLKGVKNIREYVTLEFYNKTLTKEAELEKTNIKAIYGPNGAGKTAIIHAVNIYKEITNTGGYLFSLENQNYLRQIINKSSNEFSIKMDFFIYDDKNHLIKDKLLHELVIILENNEFVIKNEKLSRRLTRKDELLFESKDGKVIFTTLIEEINDFAKHQLRKRSIIDLGMEYIITNNKKIDYKQYFDILGFSLFSSSLYINTREIDNHLFFLQKINKTNKILQFNENLIIRGSSYEIRLHKEVLTSYLEMSNGLESFLKIFKNDLKKLDYEIKYDKDFVVLEPILIYEDFKVHLEFESAGIKKLFELYMPFKAFENGAIVFIDELDANINDIYLMKLLEYFNESNQGQLVFTTHNISPMEVIDKNKHSIDFITDDLQIVKWTRSGNYSPVNIYRSGLVKGLPFNIYSFDFLGVFKDKSE